MYNVIRVLIIFLSLNSFSLLGNDIKIIRDAETESFFEELAKPILNTAKISEDSVSFYLDHQKYINAFVTGGYNIFFTTEMIINMDSVNQVAAVIAHEVGHISGGHFTKFASANNDSVLISILSSILAIGAYATGSANAGNAILMGGASLGKYNALNFSRKQENYADQAALRFLEQTEYDLMGLYDLLTIIQKRERLAKINPYNMTHPLSNERKRIVRTRIEEIGKKEYVLNKKLEKKFKLVQAKLIGFLSSEDIFELYYPEINSIESLYGKVYQHLKKGEIDQAIEKINRCISLDKKNEYFYELKGQIFYENGNFTESIKNLRIAKSLNNNEKYFELLLAKALFQTNKKKNIGESKLLLKNYIKDEQFPVEALHFLALCYAQSKEFALYSITLSEKFLLLKDIKNAKLHLEKAKMESNNNPNILRLIDDLNAEIDKLELQ